MKQDIINKYEEALERYIAVIEEEYTKIVAMAENNTFLRDNFTYNGDVLESLVNLSIALLKRNGHTNALGALDVLAEECYNFYKLYDPNSTLTLSEVKEAFYTCELGAKSSLVRKYDRYKESVELLTRMKNVFVRSGLGNNQTRAITLKAKKEKLDQFKKLYEFLHGSRSDIELKNLDEYNFSFANLSDEEWLVVYNHLLKLQIGSYKNDEDNKRNIKLEEIRRHKEKAADIVEQTILKNLGGEEVQIIKAEDENIPVIEETNSVVEKVAEPEELELPILEGKIIDDEAVVTLYKSLKEKVKKYHNYSRISETKAASFKDRYLSLENGNTLEYYREYCYSHDDYISFLYYCFVTRFNLNTVDLSYKYPEDEMNFYVEIMLSDLNKTKEYVDLLEAELQKDIEQGIDLEAKNSTEEVVEVPEKATNVLFYADGVGTEILKSIKDMSIEKIIDLDNILTKLENGNFRHFSISKYVPIPFRGIKGQNIFVTFRMINDDHILVYMAVDHSELGKIDSKLARYDKNVENAYNAIINEHTLNYEELIRRNKQIRQGIAGLAEKKGVSYE